MTGSTPTDWTNIVCTVIGIMVSALILIGSFVLFTIPNPDSVEARCRRAGGIPVWEYRSGMRCFSENAFIRY